MLNARIEYFDEEYLASSYLGTPDFCRTCWAGAQIVVRWCIPIEEFPGPLQCKLTVRTGDHEIHTYCRMLDSEKGYWTFRLLNDAYYSSKGIISYKIELFYNGQCVETFRHHLWVEILEIG